MQGEEWISLRHQKKLHQPRFQRSFPKSLLLEEHDSAMCIGREQSSFFQIPACKIIALEYGKWRGKLSSLKNPSAWKEVMEKRQYQICPQLAYSLMTSATKSLVPPTLKTQNKKPRLLFIQDHSRYASIGERVHSVKTSKIESAALINCNTSAAQYCRAAYMRKLHPQN